LILAPVSGVPPTVSFMRWSCGLMVIRNAKRRMIGLPVGSWDDEVDPDRVIKEVVGDCQTFLEDDALQPSPLSKKRK
jgi:hypothetical protein